ncbi:SDR family NAD(P)-dependent oxidoreductase [Thalassiella azotivora]
MSEPTDAPQTTSTRPLALVTGASSGIGLELARQLLARGHDVLAAAEDESVHRLPDDLGGAGGVVHAVRCDLATADGVEELVRSLDALERRLDVACLNAGVGAHGRFDEVPLADDLRVVELNVTGTVRLAKAVVLRMVAEGGGRLLLTASVAATMPGPLYATYAASKSFVQSFGRALREELDDRGVVVTTLLPGPTDTAFFDRAGMQGTRAAEGPKDDPEDVALAGLDALLAGRGQVTPGSGAARTALNKAQVAAAGLLPDAVRARIHGVLTRRPDDA